MKHILTFILLLLSASCFSSALIRGTVKNSKSEFVNLTYMGSCTVSSPNYYGEKRYSQEIRNNSFEFIINTDTKYSVFILDFLEDRESIRLLIQDKDTLQIKIDLNDILNTFEATGKNSAMTNYLFAENLIIPNAIPDLKSSEIIPYWKIQQTNQIELLKSFQSKTINNPDKYDKETNLAIKRILNISNLSNNNISYLLNRTNYYIATTISRTPFDYLINNLDDYLKLYSEIDLSEGYILNDFVTDDLVGSLIRITGYQEGINETNSYNRKDLSRYLTENYFAITRKVLKGELRQKTICDNLYNLLIDGLYEKYEKEYTESQNLISNSTYRTKLETFYSNYMSAFDNLNFSLNTPEKELNDSTMSILLDSFKGEKIYLTLWQANASYPLTPMWQLSTIEKLLHKYSTDVRFVNICIGNKVQKKHWASLIVNHNWRGEHYFYLDKDDSKFRRQFEFIDALKSCNGELFYLLGESGEILINNSSELIMKIE